jgi:hypothetical protein
MPGARQMTQALHARRRIPATFATYEPKICTPTSYFARRCQFFIILLAMSFASKT